MPYGHRYVLRKELTISTAITVLQIKAGAATPLEILSAYITQRGGVTSLQEAIGWARKSAAATVTAAIVGTDLFKLAEGDPSPDAVLSTSGTGWNASAEGTDADVPRKIGFNVLAGCYMQSLPEERILVRAGGIIGLKFFNAPTSQTWDIEVFVRELG